MVKYRRGSDRSGDSEVSRDGLKPDRGKGRGKSPGKGSKREPKIVEPKKFEEPEVKVERAFFSFYLVIIFFFFVIVFLFYNFVFRFGLRKVNFQLYLLRKTMMLIWKVMKTKKRVPKHVKLKIVHRKLRRKMIMILNKIKIVKKMIVKMMLSNAESLRNF